MKKEQKLCVEEKGISVEEKVAGHFQGVKVTVEEVKEFGHTVHLEEVYAFEMYRPYENLKKHRPCKVSSRSRGSMRAMYAMPDSSS